MINKYLAWCERAGLLYPVFNLGSRLLHVHAFLGLALLGLFCTIHVTARPVRWQVVFGRGGWRNKFLLVLVDSGEV